MKEKGKGSIAVVLLAGLGLWLLSRQADGEPPVIYTCPHCGATFTSQALLDAHIAAEHPSVVYTCPHCGAGFATQAELYAHIAAEHPSVVYTCPHCGAGFATQAELDAHIGTYHPAAEFNWLRPTGHISGGWNDEGLAYDGWTDTRAEVTGVGTQSWSPYLELTVGATEISAVRWWGNSPIIPKTIQIDVHYAGGSYHNIYEGSEVILWEGGLPIPGGPQIIDGARIRLYNNSRRMSMKFRVNEFAFYGAGEPPEPPIPPPTTNLTGYVTDKITGAPIPGATGTVYQDKGTKTYPHDFITNAAGYYEITGMIDDADQNLMVIYASGYEAHTDEHVSINKGDNQLNVSMERE